ncbi:MAG: leucyl/phenylalanyl-tRNA--protein transferase [Bdellovibrionota bacterium]
MEAPIEFPDPSEAGPEGFLAVGGNLNVSKLLSAYRAGIFPWPMTGFPLAWFSPDPRAILTFDKFHVPRSLQKAKYRALNDGWHFSMDRAFSEVIAACAGIARKGQDGTWITPRLLAAYLALHRAGYAHSIELWDRNGKLLAGMYGVEVDGIFSGESMFHHASNGSKLVLEHTIEYLKSKSATWMDIQVMTPHLQALGAEEMERGAFLRKLSADQRRARERQVRLFGDTDSPRKN